VKAEASNNTLILKLGAPSHPRRTALSALADLRTGPRRVDNATVRPFLAAARHAADVSTEGPDEPPPRGPAKSRRARFMNKPSLNVLIKFPQRGKTMENQITKGTILIEDGELLPESLRRQSQPYSRVWRLVKGLDQRTLGRKIEQAGWTFFYTEGEITATALGFNGEETLRRTINRVIAKLKWDKFNCLEITRVVEKRVLGFSMVTVVACWRLLGPSLQNTPEMSVPSARLFQRRLLSTQESARAA
jgi:hypothetical protein